jgi:hypothetical protein
MNEQALRYGIQIPPEKINGTAVGAACVRDNRLDPALCSEYLLVAERPGRDQAGVSLHETPTEVTLRGISHTIVMVDGVPQHNYAVTIFARTIVTTPTIRGALAQGANEFGKKLFPKPNKS